MRVEANGTVGGASEPGLEGVPALPACRVRLVWEADSAVAASVAERERERPTVAQLATRDPEGMYTPAQPFWAPVAGAALMTAPDSDRRVRVFPCFMPFLASPILAKGRPILATHVSGAPVGKPGACRVQVIHMSLDIGGSGMPYQPGDSIGICPRNNPTLVQRLLKRLGADGSRVLSKVSAAEEDGTTGSTAADSKAHLLPHLNWPCTLQEAITVRDLLLFGER